MEIRPLEALAFEAGASPQPARDRLPGQFPDHLSHHRGELRQAFWAPTILGGPLLLDSTAESVPETLALDVFPLFPKHLRGS